MSIGLPVFLAWHLELARRNMTSNESIKFDTFYYTMNREEKVLSELINECEEYEELNQQSMLPLKIDGVEMPTNRAKRIAKLKEMDILRLKRHNKLNGTYPVKSLFGALKDIWNEK